MITAACWAPICGLNDEDVVLSPLPLFHSYGLNLSVLSVLASGQRAHPGRFSPDKVLELFAVRKYSVFPGVPTMFHYLLQRSQEAGVNRLGGTRLCISAARSCRLH